MNVKQAIPLIAAVGLGLVAMKVAHDMSVKKTPVTAQARSVEIVVAKGSIPPGSAFAAEQLELQKVPGEVPPEKSLTSIEDAVGRVSLVPIFDGQPLRQDFLCPKGTPAGLAPLVPVGMRAITIDVNETSSVAGLLLPGSHVDVISTLATADAAKPSARTVVQNVPILAVGQRLSPVKPEGDKADAGGYRTVTLLASPHDAELIELATTASRTRLILRGVNDDLKVTEDGVNFVELLGHQHDDQVQVKPMPISFLDPTTQPTQNTHHVTQIIKAGTANNVDFELAAPDPATMTETDGSPAIKQ